MATSILRSALPKLAYELACRRRQAAGDVFFHPQSARPLHTPFVEVWVSSDVVGADEASEWSDRSGSAGVTFVGHRQGTIDWRLPADGGAGSAAWFSVSSALPRRGPLTLGARFLAATAEGLDALAWQPSEDDRPDFVDLLRAPLRSGCLFRRGPFQYDAEADAVVATGAGGLAKIVGPEAPHLEPRDAEHFHRTRRGPYLSRRPMGARLKVEIDDLSGLVWPAEDRPRPVLLVTTPFLARGGAEHTLYETLRLLADRWEIVLVTLAPHRPELGDRRADFLEITPHLYCLGDLAHPAAMPGIVRALVRRFEPPLLYNANGSTIFYELAPELKSWRPSLGIVDHLYDHRVGYVERYQRSADGLRSSVDICIAENRRIAEELTDRLGWPRERVPVTEPCGRSSEAFPPPEQRGAVRRRLRAELGFGPDDVVFLTAARAHPQKRPLDLVALASRTLARQARFLWVGGGPLEGAFDDAIAKSGLDTLRRLPFREDIPELILACDVGCLVSAFEGLPVFMLECLQAGRPFLGTDVGDVAHVLRSTGAGLVVDRPGDLDALAAAVDRFLDRRTREAMAKRAKEVGPAFSVERCAERYSAVFDRFL